MNMNDYINKVIQGECEKVLREFPENSIDTIITDPPYGLSFMGKKWDYKIPSIEQWSECLRVAKPGATLLCFGGTRTYHRIACTIEDAGWILKDCIMWIYGSGFPKATDISKQLDKKAGAERESVGRNPNSRENCDKSNTLYESGTVGKTDNITEPATEQSKLWNGWKSHGLKPAYEPIIIAVKPNDGSYAENALKWGVAGLNIDGGRVEYQSEKDKNSAIPQGRITTKSSNSGVGAVVGGVNDYEIDREKWKEEKQKGRYPANVIHDGSAEVVSLFPNTKNGGQNTTSHRETWLRQETKPSECSGDYGSASRFFKECKITKEDLVCQDQNQVQLNVSTAEKNLYPKRQVGDFVARLVAIEAFQEDNVLNDIIRPFMNEIRRQLKTTTEINIQQMKSIGKKSLQELKHTITEKLNQNPAKYAEIQKLINTMTIIQNLMNIGGSAEVVILNTMFRNMVLGEKVSRIKYCAKASKAERNMGCEELETKTACELTGRKEGSKGLSGSKEYGNSTNPYANGGSVLPRANHHPTVKPLKLMEYLCTITKTPTGGIVLDPFLGSGTTAIACVKTGRDFIGIEKEPEYCEIARKRIAGIEKTLFDKR